MLGLVLDHMNDLGGVPAIEQRAIDRAGAVYGAINESGGFYRNAVSAGARSRMSAPFTLPTRELEKKFLQEAEDNLGLHVSQTIGALIINPKGPKPLHSHPNLPAVPPLETQFIFGHPIQGGVRITLYNWVTDESVNAVVAHMKEFAARHKSDNAEL